MKKKEDEEEEEHSKVSNPVKKYAAARTLRNHRKRSGTRSLLGQSEPWTRMQHLSLWGKGPLYAMPAHVLGWPRHWKAIIRAYTASQGDVASKAGLSSPGDFAVSVWSALLISILSGLSM